MVVHVGHSWVVGLLLSSLGAFASGGVIGTYSSLRYNSESGDLNGLEITVVPTDSGLIAVVELAEDGINELHLAKVKKSDGKLLFAPRLDDGTEVRFSMECTPRVCKGTYHWGRALIKFELPKSHGFWNRE